MEPAQLEELLRETIDDVHVTSANVQRVQGRQLAMSMVLEALIKAHPHQEHLTDQFDLAVSRHREMPGEVTAVSDAMHVALAISRRQLPST